MARKSRRQSKTRRHSRTRKQQRKQYRKQQRRQRGGVSDDLPTIDTFGVPVVAMNYVAKASISVPGLAGQRTPNELRKRAENGEGLPVDY